MTSITGRRRCMSQNPFSQITPKGVLRIGTAASISAHFSLSPQGKGVL